LDELGIGENLEVFQQTLELVSRQQHGRRSSMSRDHDAIEMLVGTIE